MTASPKLRPGGTGPRLSTPVIAMAVFVVFTVFNLFLLSRYRESIEPTRLQMNQGDVGGGGGHRPHSGHMSPHGSVHLPHAPPSHNPAVPSVPQGKPPFSVDSRTWHGWSSIDDVIKARVPKADWRPSNDSHARDSNAGAAALAADTGCDVLTVPFDPASDRRCVEYLTDTGNWLELVPLAMRFDARTIKFQVRFKNSALHSVLKVPQRLFPNEAFSEVAAYHADRVLEVNRVPPTGWVCIPTKTIRNATATFGAGVETEAEFLKDSGVKTYAEWIDKDLFDYAAKVDLIEHGADGDAACIGASIQLYMADVHHLLDSPLKIPYKAHNTSWHRFFNLTSEDHRHPLARIEHKPWVASIISIAELNAFDYVIGNGDRSPNKNNFVVGKCNRHASVCNEDTDQFRARWIHPGPPTFVHLDQGMGFYDKPRNNPLYNAVKAATPTYCLFRTPMLNRLWRLAEDARRGSDAGSFGGLMASRLPKMVGRFVTKTSLRKCQRRIEDVLGLAAMCAKQPFHRAVFTP